MVRIGEVGQNGDFRCLGLWQGGEFAQLQGLDREPQPVISNLRRMLATLVCDQFGYGQPAEPALARAHAAPEKHLHLVRTACACAHGRPDLSG